MNAKRVIGIIFTTLVLLLLAVGARASQMRDVAAEAPRVPQAQPAVQRQSAEQARPAAIPAQAPPAETIAGAFVTQVFTLSAGWNAIYLGVEPVNGSELGDDGIPTKSVMEWVFGGLAASGALESVWTYSQPVSSRDYLIDPDDGLWNEPGWLRYIPDENTGPDGVSREFLTTLHTLHANTGYLVKLKDGTSGTITVSGKPVPGHHRWTPGAYNLAGFPLAAGGKRLDLVTAGSTITETRALTAAGEWSAPLAAGVSLLPGVTYLVRYPEQPASTDFTAPLDVGVSEEMLLPTEGLKFQAGLQGKSLDLRLENLSASSVEAKLTLLEGAASSVALHYMTNDDPPVLIDLRDPDAPKTFTLGVGGANAKWVKLQVPTEEQPAAGATILEVSCASLGTRWLIPVSAEPGSYAGLWVGDVVVNDVSEARLGSTDDAHDLTIALASQNDSGVRGAAEIHEKVAGATSTLTISITLALPDETVETVTPPEVTAPYVHGWVFVDANRNGQRDADEKGLAGVQVGVGTATPETLADGSYWKGGMSAGTYALSITTPDGYTSDFTVNIPAEVVTTTTTALPNALPASITLTSKGATGVTPEDYLAQILPEPAGYPTTPYLPYYDAYDKRVEPPLNFGLVRADRAVLRAGLCDNPRNDIAELGTVKNGELIATYAATLASLVGDAHIAIERSGAGVACGNLVVGAPTAFDGGKGSEARFRIVLRVSQSGQTGLVPYYVLKNELGQEVRRVSAVNFLSMQHPFTVTGPFGTVGAGLQFDLTLQPNDPLNPFKHKYNPDHDNLDRAFAGYNETVPLYLYESYLVKRRVTLVLTDLPPGVSGTDATGLDWGGTIWGGDYREVIEGLHQNKITATGYFVIRRVVAPPLVLQDYDQ